MAVDLGDLVDSLKREVSPPGVEMFPDASEDDFLGNLQDAFWEARLDGMLAGYEERDAVVSSGFVLVGDAYEPLDENADLGRDLQQLIVLYAGIRIIRNDLRNLNTTFRSKAGPVEFETQKSAQVLKGILDELRTRRNIVLERLSDLGSVPSYYIDSLRARDDALGWSNIDWIG